MSRNRRKRLEQQRCWHRRCWHPNATHTMKFQNHYLHEIDGTLEADFQKCHGLLWAHYVSHIFPLLMDDDQRHSPLGFAAIFIRRNSIRNLRPTPLFDSFKAKMKRKANEKTVSLIMHDADERLMQTWSEILQSSQPIIHY